MATPRATARAQTRRIVSASPAWKPHATFALVTIASRDSSSPRRHAPKLSPRSALRSTTRCVGVIRVPPSGLSTGQFRQGGSDVALPRPGRGDRLDQQVLYVVP